MECSPLFFKFVDGDGREGRGTLLLSMHLQEDALKNQYHRYDVHEVIWRSSRMFYFQTNFKKRRNGEVTISGCTQCK